MALDTQAYYLSKLCVSTVHNTLYNPNMQITLFIKLFCQYIKPITKILTALLFFTNYLHIQRGGLQQVNTNSLGFKRACSGFAIVVVFGLKTDRKSVIVEAQKHRPRAWIVFEVSIQLCTYTASSLTVSNCVLNIDPTYLLKPVSSKVVAYLGPML